MKKKIIIGTRGSNLALWQANWVKAEILKKNPELSVNLLIIKTKGDKILDTPLAKIGGKGLFVKEIEEALLQNRIDIAVHSMKDMPAKLPVGLCIGAVPLREVPNDILISKNKTTFLNLKNEAKIGTSSLRRAAQLKNLRPDIEIIPLRGNLGTRIKKLETENLDAIVLAAAGVIRLGFKEKITETLPVTTMLPAVGQGALCIEIRENDNFINSIVCKLEDKDTRTVVMGERAFLNKLEGGCQVPIAAFGSIIDNNLFSLCGLVAAINGSEILKETITGKITDPEKIGIKLAENLINKGAGKILESLSL